MLTIGTSGHPHLSSREALGSREAFLKQFSKWEPAEVSTDPAFSAYLLIDPKLNEQKKAAFLCIEDLSKHVSADGTIELSAVSAEAQRMISGRFVVTYNSKVEDNSLISVIPRSEFELTDGTRTINRSVDANLAPEARKRHEGSTGARQLTPSERSTRPPTSESARADFHITSFGFPEDGVRQEAAEAVALKAAEKLVKRWRTEFNSACEQLRDRLRQVALDAPKPGQKLDDYKDSARLKEEVAKFWSVNGFASESEAKDFLTRATFGNVRFGVLVGVKSGSINGTMVMDYFSLRPQFLK